MDAFQHFNGMQILTSMDAFPHFNGSKRASRAGGHWNMAESAVPLDAVMMLVEPEKMGGAVEQTMRSMMLC